MAGVCRVAVDENVKARCPPAVLGPPERASHAVPDTVRVVTLSVDCHESRRNLLRDRTGDGDFVLRAVCPFQGARDKICLPIRLPCLFDTGGSVLRVESGRGAQERHAGGRDHGNRARGAQAQVQEGEAHGQQGSRMQKGGSRAEARHRKLPVSKNAPPPLSHSTTASPRALACELLEPACGPPPPPRPPAAPSARPRAQPAKTVRYGKPALRCVLVCTRKMQVHYQSLD